MQNGNYSLSTQAPSGGYGGYYGNGNHFPSPGYPLRQQYYQNSQYGDPWGRHAQYGQHSHPEYPPQPPPQPYNTEYYRAQPNARLPSYGSGRWQQPPPNSQHSMRAHSAGFSKPFGDEGQGRTTVTGSDTEATADQLNEPPGDHQPEQSGRQERESAQESHENPGDAHSTPYTIKQTQAHLEEKGSEARKTPDGRKDEPVSTVNVQKAIEPSYQTPAHNTHHASSTFPAQTQSRTYPARDASLDPSLILEITFGSLNLGSRMKAPDELNRGYSLGHGQPPPAVTLMQQPNSHGFPAPATGEHSGFGLRPHSLPAVRLDSGEISQFSTSVEGRPSYGGMVIL
mmetsp:Transcript_17436/g.25026  ORF Transcript_17436/g.25026 Transcript_17436/m.25026 type:complete len:341 (+) Transcript_17436:1315-2337(+)